MSAFDKVTPTEGGAAVSSGLSAPSAEKIRHVQTWINSWVKCGALPGIQLGIYDRTGQELFYHATDVKGQYTRESIFRIYSMTKPITSVACMILVERGILSVDDEVSRWIPAFANTEVLVGGTVDAPVTEKVKEPLRIRHLLSHTSGITYGIFGNSVCDQLLKRVVGDDYLNWFHYTDLTTLCDKIAQVPFSFQPGSKFLYSLSTDVLGRIIEIASGLSLDAFFQKEIFIPLEMIDTGFQVPDSEKHRLMEIYEVAVGQGYKVSTNPERDRLEPPILLAGGGGLVSTLADYAKFGTCLLNGGLASNGIRLLQESTIVQMTSNQLLNNADLLHFSFDQGFSEVIGAGYGFGWGFSVLLDPSVAKGGELSGRGEYGWGGVAATNFSNDPENNLSIIFMTQLIPGAAVYPLRSQLRWLSHWLFTEEK